MTAPPAVTRRDVIAGSAAAGTALLAACGGSGAGGAADDPAAFMTALIVQLFPHEGLDPRVYAETAARAASALEASPGGGNVLAAARTELDARAGGDWIAQSPAQKRAALEASQNTAWFSALYRAALTEFYSHPAVWDRLGYPGSSLEYGGYIDRGFDDIDWLAEARDGAL